MEGKEDNFIAKGSHRLPILSKPNTMSEGQIRSADLRAPNLSPSSYVCPYSWIIPSIHSVDLEENLRVPLRLENPGKYASSNTI